MLTESEEKILEVHKDAIYAKCVLDLKMIFDRKNTLEFLINTYTDVEGEPPPKNTKLKRWFLANFDATVDGWAKKHRWLH